MTCGVGKKRKTRKCQDSATKQPMQPGLDCIGGKTHLSEDCKLGDCPSKEYANISIELVPCDPAWECVEVRVRS